MIEIWKEHPLYNGIYLVSNTGKIKSVNQRKTGNYHFKYLEAR